MPADKVTSWSYSRLSDFETCPRRFRYKHLDKLPEPRGPSLERGIRVHEDCAAFLAGKLRQPTSEIESFGVGMFEMLRSLNPFVEQQWGFTAKWRQTGWFAADTWLRVALDAAVLYPDDTGLAVDHKTGKKYGSNDDQMELYALAFMCRYPQVKKVETRLWYLDSGDEEIAEFTADDKSALREKWNRRAAGMLSEQVFPARPNPKCRFCAFAKGAGGPCEFG